MRGSVFSLSIAALPIALAAYPAIAASPKTEQAQASAPHPVVVSDDKLSPAKTRPDFDAILGIFDKLFPPQPDPDPGRLALARTSAQAIWPQGAYAKMMSTFVGSLFDRVMQMKKSDLAALDTKATKMSPAGSSDVTIHDQATAKDPYFDQRTVAIREVLNEEVAKISAIIDPRMREGLARSMARRFDARQLTEINSFFATPSGRALASQYMQLWLDPDAMRSLFGTMPEMMKLMPEIMQKVKAANDKFPKPPAPAKPDKH